MTITPPSSRSIVIYGDVTTDCNIAPVPEDHENERDTLNIARNGGSVLMLAELIKGIVPDTVQTYSHKTEVDPEAPSFYIKCKEFEAEKDNPKRSKDKAWRIAEIIGFEKGRRCEPPLPTYPNDPKDADIVVLDDGNLGFRDHPEVWPEAIEEGQNPWILIKMVSELAKGSLWDRLRDHHKDRLIALVTIEDLRCSDVRISRALSWEQTALDVMREMRSNNAINALNECAFVVIMLGLEGAIILSKSETPQTSAAGGRPPQGSLIFDPQRMEGEWRLKYPGKVLGYKNCMAASIAKSLAETDSKIDRETIKDGVYRGLAAMRKLHEIGYHAKKGSVPDLTFPFEDIVKFLKEFSRDKSPFEECELISPKDVEEEGLEENKQTKPDLWTILSDKYKERLYQVAEEVAEYGVKTRLKNVPCLEFGKLLTVDRREIESYRSIRTLVKEYAESKIDKPLSIAVFGAPGSGKSFGITQMAESLFSDQIKTRTFNLSQLGSEDDLWPAMHQVRDVGLSGKLPLVFWDEFDTTLNKQALGWLRYFLAPMQDGKFQDGQVTHYIGKAIFVFAGGTSETFSIFDKTRKKTADTKEAEEKNLEKYKKLKLPDFISRLKGFINILGPNKAEKPEGGNDDKFFVVRRAILLRSLLLRDAPYYFKEEKNNGETIEKLKIDKGVLRAFLQTTEYYHGSRSMEYLIAMCTKGEGGSFDRSSLPSQAQLDLHVNADEFMDLVYTGSDSGVCYTS
jgi:hypothetical protein